MRESNEKRMVGNTGYEVKRSIHLGDREVLVAEDMKAADDNFYLVANYSDNGLIGEYSRCVVSSDYLEIMQEFTKRVDEQMEKARAVVGKEDFQVELITASQCYPHDYGQRIVGKVVAIKAEVLRPEYRRGDVQLVFVSGGNGGKANPMGDGVYCYHLNNGQHTRFERYDVLGEIKVLPDWAKERLAVIQAEKESTKNPQQTKAEPEVVHGYTITERIKVGQKTFVLGENPNAVQKFVTWQQHEGRSGYDLGHYMNDRDKAMADLHTRADSEREGASPNKTRKPRDRDDAR